MPSRILKQSEVELARQVFEDQLPYGKVHIASYYLPGNDGVPVTLASVSSIIPVRSLRQYTIYFGPDVYRDGADAAGVRDTFIHELTHVWQSVHRDHPLDYIGDSLLNQLRYRDAAYTLDPSKVGAAEWASFGAEQQAMIVENWYADGMSEADKAFVYIRDHIRQGKA
jgi:hypothetical protein